MLRNCKARQKTEDHGTRRSGDIHTLDTPSADPGEPKTHEGHIHRREYNTEDGELATSIKDTKKTQLEHGYLHMNINKSFSQHSHVVRSGR